MVGVVATMLVARLLDPGAESVRLFGLEIPVACSLRAVTGFPCPGCGLTRAFVFLAHGRFAEGVAIHPIAPLVLGWLLLEALRHGLWLGLSSSRPAIERVGWWLDRSGWLVAVALFVGWIVRLSA